MELHELRNPVTYPQKKPNSPQPTQILNRVPLVLLPLLSEPSTPPHPSEPASKARETDLESGVDTIPSVELDTHNSLLSHEFMDSRKDGGSVPSPFSPVVPKYPPRKALGESIGPGQPIMDNRVGCGLQILEIFGQTRLIVTEPQDDK